MGRPAIPTQHTNEKIRYNFIQVTHLPSPLHLFSAAFGTSFVDPSVSNSRQLKDALYTSWQADNGGAACVRLLHADGVIGCAAPSNIPVSGPLILVNASSLASDIPPGSVALVSAADGGDFLRRCSTEEPLQARLVGVLLQHSDDFPGWNPAPISPSFERRTSYLRAAEDTVPGHQWNPKGKGIVHAEFPFPVFQLDNVTSPIALQRAKYNAEIKVRVNVDMQFSHRLTV